jgi:hypothetical protein
MSCCGRSARNCYRLVARVEFLLSMSCNTIRGARSEAVDPFPWPEVDTRSEAREHGKVGLWRGRGNSQALVDHLSRSYNSDLYLHSWEVRKVAKCRNGMCRMGANAHSAGHGMRAVGGSSGPLTAGHDVVWSRKSREVGARSGGRHA